ncbi:hypothetical protein F5880DRAFT_1604363, partial [Lentinula raphanica]
MEDVLRFQKRFGALHPNMKMEWTQSRFQLPFLDLEISLELKPGAILYIPWKSCHSDDSKRAWVKGELTRYVRICSRL